MPSDIREFLRGAWALGPWWRVWMVALLAVNLVAPVVFLPQVPAVVTLVATFTALPVAIVLVHVQGRYTRLLGLIHAPWLPMLATSLSLYPWNEPWVAYKTWLSLSIILSSISLVIDASDVYRFLGGSAES